MAKYKKSDGFCTTDGQDLEVKLSALVYLRAVRAGLPFQLATNVHGMGVLDDIVFRVRDSDTRKWATCFVQTKHKQNAAFEITADMFTSAKGDYYLAKFIKSYDLINKAIASTADRVGDEPNLNVDLLDGDIEDCVFVIFTNAKTDGSLGDMFNVPTEELWYQRLLRTNAEGKIFSFSSGCDNIKRAFGEQEESFRDKLKLLYCQSSLRGFDALIRDELRQLRVDGTILDAVSDTLLSALKEWWAQPGAADVLCSDAMFRDAVSVVEVRSLCLEAERKARLHVTFQDAALQRLAMDVNKAWTVLHVQSSERSALLSSTKFLQAFSERCLFVGIEELLAAHESVLSVWKRKETKLLVVHVGAPEAASGARCAAVGRTLFEVLNTSDSGRRAVIVSHARDGLTNALSELLGERFLSHRDTFEFSQISESDRAKLDGKLELQGHAVSLLTFLSGARDLDDLEDLEADALKWSLLVDVIRCEGKLSAGSALPEDIGHFIPRTLERATELPIEILEGGRVSQSVTVFYSSVADIIAVFSALAPEFKDFMETFVALSHLPLVPDKENEVVSCSSVLRLGGYECSNVGLRNGRPDQVVALRIHPAKGASNGNSFLFVEQEANEADVALLSNFNSSKHFLRLGGGKLHWVKSVCGMHAIRGLVGSEGSTVTAAQVEERVVLLCAEPGMGKSTLMAHLARHFKGKCPESWVIRISLNDQTKLFFENKHLDALQFLLAAAKIEAPSQRALFELALNKWGDVVVLLDGFDEIAPKYADQCCVLMTRLLATRARKVWVTSRNTMKEKLEDHLRTLALKLRKFSEDDQRRFFLRYWEQKKATPAEPGQHRKAEIDAFITRLIEMTSSATSDRERELMGIPLQTQIVADVYEQHVPGACACATPLPGRLDLLGLLDRFVDKKLDIYVAEKLRLEEHQPGYDQLCAALRTHLYTGHMAAALVTILSSEDLAGLNESIANESWALCEETRLGKEKTGIVESVVDGKPRFVHRVFAEFFVARWLVQNYRNHELFLQKRLFTANFRVVRSIFDRMLASGHGLHTAVLNEDIDSARTLLSKKDFDVDSKDQGGRTALLLAATSGPVEGDKEVRRCREMLGLLANANADVNLKDDVLKRSPLWYGDVTESWIAVDTFIGRYGADATCLANTSKQMERQQLLDYVYSHDLAALVGFYLDVNQQDRKKQRPGQLLARACQHGGPNIAKLLAERGADVVEGEKGLPPPFHLACQSGQLAVAKVIQGKVVDALARHDDSERRTVTADFINRHDRSASNALAHAANHNRVEIVEYLIGQGADQRMCTRHLAFAVQNLTREKLKVLELLLKAIPEAVERHAYVNAPEGPDGYTAVHVAAMFGAVEALRLLVDAGGELGPVGVRRRTALMAASSAKRCDPDLVKYILEVVAGNEDVLSAAFVNLRDSDGRTALHHSSCRDHGLVQYLLDRGADVWIQDNEGRTIWHVAAQRGNMEVLRALCDAVPDARRAEYLALGDGDGNTALHVAASGRWDFLQPLEFFVEVGVRATQVNNAGQTPLMVAAQLNSWPKMEHILGAFDEVLEGRSVAQHVAERDARGRTALHHAAASPAAHRLEEALRSLLDPVSQDYRRALVHAEDNDGHTAISLLLDRKNAPKKCVKLLRREGRPLG